MFSTFASGRYITIYQTIPEWYRVMMGFWAGMKVVGSVRLVQDANRHNTTCNKNLF